MVVVTVRAAFHDFCLSVSAKAPEMPTDGRLMPTDDASLFDFDHDDHASDAR